MLQELDNKLKALRTLNYVLSELEEALEKERGRLIREKYEKLDIVHGLFLYLKSMKYPLDIYDSCGIDRGEYDRFKHVKIKVVYDYDYTDVMGLTKKQFKKLNKLIAESWEK